jgi:hypothetical protein
MVFMDSDYQIPSHASKPASSIIASAVATTAEYADTLRAAGAEQVARSGPHWSMHPPARVVTAAAPAAELYRPPTSLAT